MWVRKQWQAAPALAGRGTARRPTHARRQPAPQRPPAPPRAAPSERRLPQKHTALPVLKCHWAARPAPAGPHAWPGLLDKNALLKAGATQVLWPAQVQVKYSSSNAPCARDKTPLAPAMSCLVFTITGASVASTRSETCAQRHTLKRQHLAWLLDTCDTAQMLTSGALL